MSEKDSKKGYGKATDQTKIFSDNFAKKREKHYWNWTKYTMYFLICRKNPQQNYEWRVGV